MEKAQIGIKDGASLILQTLGLPINTPLEKIRHSINAIDTIGETVLHKLIKSRNLPIITSALAHLGADPNCATSDGLSPLHCAVLYYPDAIPTLITYGANINMVDKLKKTSLHYAVIANKKGALKFLLEERPDLELRTREGDTALYIATTQGSEESVSLLLKAGAQDTKVDGTMGNLSPLMLSSLLNHVSLTRIFCSSKQKDGLSGQFYAAAFEPDLIIPFYQAGFLVTATDQMGRIPLHYACAAAVGLLLSLGASPYAADREGNRPIHLAAGNNESSLAEFIKLKLDLEIKDGKKKTPIFHAIEEKNWKNFMSLFERVDRNAVTELGETLLHYAIKMKNEAVSQFLIKQRLFLHTLTAAQQTPLHYAVLYFPELIPVLVEAGANIFARDGQGMQLIHIATLSNGAALPFLVSMCDIDALDDRGNSPLVLADKSNNIQAIRFLLARNVRKVGLAIAGSCNRKQLHFFAQYYPEKVAQELASMPQFVNIRDNNGWNVAHYAALYHPELLPLLASTGVNMNFSGSDNHTPFSLAFLYNKPAMKQVIQAGGHSNIPKDMLMRIPRAVRDMLRYQKFDVGDLPPNKDDEEFMKKHLIVQVRGYATQRTSDSKK